MKKSYVIELIGCDDTTRFLMELNEKEFKLIEKISKISKETSSYGCMPTLVVEEYSRTLENE